MRVLLVTFCVIALMGCKPKQNAPSSPQAPTQTSDEIQDQKNALNNLVISFYSKGSGSNQAAVQTIENFLEEYSTKTTNPIPYSKVAWGREGEVDFCISLSGLGAGEKKNFIDNIRMLVKQYELINFLENYPCRQIK